MNILKKIFRRLAIILVTLWSKLVFEQGVKAAEERRLYEINSETKQDFHGNCMIYLACNSFRPDHLVTYTKKQFKEEKHVYGQAARLLTMNTLKNGCYYYTADRWGRNGITEKEKDRRKKAFIKERLQLAKLI